MGDEFANPPVNNRFRVNDPFAATHPSFHDRKEPKGNGMMLIPMLDSLREIKAARLYLELWGGHPHTNNRRVTINGRSTYPIDIPVDDQCSHAYRQIPIKITDLVRGQNALQFAVDADNTFWGHFIVEEAAIDALIASDHGPLREFMENATMPPMVSIDKSEPEMFSLTLPVSPALAAKIAQVHYYAKYEGYDENGDGVSNDWHGMTKRKTPLGHVGTADSAPYQVRWDTSMLKAQRNVQVRAIVEFLGDDATIAAEQRLREEGQRYWKAQSLCFQTSPSGDLSIEHPAGIDVAYFSALNQSVPFWSRANRLRTCDFALSVRPLQIDRGLLAIAAWTGGAGEVKDYFQLNGQSLAVAEGSSHEVVFSQVAIDPRWLNFEKNQVSLLSDTEHHGIEVLFPGPMLSIRYRTEQSIE